MRFTLKLGFSVLIAFALLEALLHIFPTPYTDFHSNFQYVGDKDLGYRPVANQDATCNIECVQVPHVKTNSLGFRGPEWTGKGSPKIALLGDSFLLALTVSDKLHVATLLQGATGGEVWNGGVSGYGTYQELLAWRKLFKDRKPDVTVVFMFVDNDVRDNHCKLCRSQEQKYSPCLAVEGGKVVERKTFEMRRPESGLKAWFKENCQTYRLIRYLRRHKPPKPGSGHFFDREDFAYNIYRPQYSQSWEDGWTVTDWALRRLKEECEAAGSKLLVATVPSVLRVAPDLRAELKAQTGSDSLPPDFVADLPVRRLQAIMDSSGIAFLDMEQPFRAYRDLHQLQDPVFGWCCDRHWNPLGHRLAADLVNNHLVQAGWIEGSIRQTASPREVLGQEMMEAIYNCETVRME